MTPWFRTPEGAALQAAETAWLKGQLQRVPAASWAWLSPAQAEDVWTGEPGCWRGGEQVMPPWPVPSASLGRVILQHVAEGHPAGSALLGEVVRVLENGGRVWLLALHARSPARRSWPRAPASTPTAWRARLRDAGLLPVGRAVPLGGADAEGLRWPLPLAFGLARYPAFVIEAEKRRLPVTPIPQRPAPAFGLGRAAGA
jgi:hypothetical protein